MPLYLFFISGQLLFTVTVLVIYFGYLNRIQINYQTNVHFIELRKNCVYVLLFLGAEIIHSLFLWLIPEAFEMVSFKIFREIPVYVGLFVVKISLIWIIVSAFQINKNQERAHKKIPVFGKIYLVIVVGVILLLLGSFLYQTNFITLGLLALFVVFSFFSRID